MKYAIIAAGEGSRLAADGIQDPKPLVKVGGERLIDRLIRIFMDNDAEEIVVICNDKTAQVAQHLMRIQRDGLVGRPVPLYFQIKSTPSSMHSLYEISSRLKSSPFVLTTVDTVFDEHDFSRYVSQFSQLSKVEDTCGLLGVTDYVDDERPLYVQTDEALNIKGFYDTNNPPCQYVSAGIYGLPSCALATLNNCINRGEQRMRNFQRALIREGMQLKAFPFADVFDIDHAEDIQKVEAVIHA